MPNALTISHLKRGLSRDEAMLTIGIMIKEVRDWFNVKGNMNEVQIALTSEMILDHPAFYDLTLGNIKACFRQRMMSEKLYDRLDGNIIIGWLREFKSEMADYCYSVKSEQRTDDTPDAISHEVYKEMLRARAQSGDKEASAILVEYEKRSRIPTEEESRRKELEFFKYKTEYLKKQKQREEKRND